MIALTGLAVLLVPAFFIVLRSWVEEGHEPKRAEAVEVQVNPRSLT
jgi:hypothetical protein